MKKEVAFVVEKCARTGLYAGHALGFPSVHSTGATVEELIRNLQQLVANIERGKMKKRGKIAKRQLIEKGLREMGQLQESDEYDADFIITPKDEGTPFKVQMWTPMVFSETLRGARNIHIAICVGGKVFCYPHDEVLEAARQQGVVCLCRTWQLTGHYTVRNKDCTKGSWAELLKPHQIYPPKP